MQLPNSAEMKTLEQSAINEFGIPGIVLMENAGAGTVNMMEKELGSPDKTFSIILIGPGNNGGDGLVIGRHLHQRGCQPIFFFMINPDKLKGDAALNLEIIRKLRLQFHIIDNDSRVKTIPVLFKQIEARGLPCYAIVDAIFGIGLNKEITGHYADAIDLLNNHPNFKKIPIIAADTPSGMNSDTGRIYKKCLKATHTAAYGCAKVGQVIHGDTSLVGKLHVIDIGIPHEAVVEAKIKTSLCTDCYTARMMLPLKRKLQSHKGMHGHCLLIAGSAGKTGAAILAAKGAVRSGAGLVSLCVPYDLNTIFETALTEVMTIPLPTSSSRINISDYKHIIQNLGKKNAVLLGPGIGTDSRTAELVVRLYQTVPLPMVVDADAITILAKYKKQLKAPAGPRIFTPHAGELSRIIDIPAKKINDNRVENALAGCQEFKNEEHEIIMILKGAGTVIASSDGSTVINTTGNPGMAAAGMGDVLGGIITAFIAQGMSCHAAACCAAYLHGQAGNMLYEEKGQGFTPTELAELIPSCIKYYLQKEQKRQCN